MISKFVYVNSYLTSFDFDEDVIDTIKKIGGLDDLVTYNNRFEDVPNELINGSEEAYNGFIDGLTYSQYANSEQIGTYLNPLLIGLSLDYNKWFKIMKKDDIQRDIVFVDIPYKTYCELVPSSLHTSEEDYNKHSNAIKRLANALQEGLRVTLH